MTWSRWHATQYCTSAGGRRPTPWLLLPLPPPLVRAAEAAPTRPPQLAVSTLASSRPACSKPWNGDDALPPSASASSLATPATRRSAAASAGVTRPRHTHTACPRASVPSYTGDHATPACLPAVAGDSCGRAAAAAVAAAAGGGAKCSSPTTVAGDAGEVAIDVGVPLAPPPRPTAAPLPPATTLLPLPLEEEAAVVLPWLLQKRACVHSSSPGA